MSTLIQSGEELAGSWLLDELVFSKIILSLVLSKAQTIGEKGNKI